MPLYEYHCERCGPFDLSRPMAEAGLPGVCLGCGGPGERRLSAPVLGLPGPATRRRLARAREPTVLERPLPEGPREPPRPRRGRGRPWQISH